MLHQSSFTAIHMSEHQKYSVSCSILKEANEINSPTAKFSSLTWHSKCKAVFWGNPPQDPRERKLLLKIDLLVMSFVCLNYWINYVDRTNVANAYVSGMKEELNMTGDNFNLINTLFTVGYVVSMIPNNVILLKVPPRYWLAFCCFAWALLTLGLYKVTSFKQVCVIRFFQACFESSTFSGTHLILGSWYKEHEISTRSATFTGSGLIGIIFSGFMQGAIYTNMDGKGGLAGWRWLFIIDCIITIPICLFGLLCFPGTPEGSKPTFFFSEEDLKMAKERLPARHHTKLDWSVLKRVVGRWHWWLFSLLWVLGGENESFGSNSLFALWLQFKKYSIENRNHYPMGVSAVGIFATYTAALYVDRTGGKNHWHIAILISAVLVVVSIMTLASPVKTGVIFTAQYLSGVSYSGQAIFFSWANTVCRNDTEERAIVLSSMNMFSGAVNAWWSILFYGATTVPKFKKGCWAMISTTVATAIVACIIRILQVREQRLQKTDTESIGGTVTYIEEDNINTNFVEKDTKIH
ncbi:related to Pantothenate transporter FEN2 [Zygosaccharomyces bailii]|nr:related to Pantothenate transporter FEN2 [Zygosaccharomyces bailii]